MGLGYWNYLSFQEIATKWASEQAAFTSDEILQELISSMILGDFEDATGVSRVELLMPKVGRAEGEAWQPFTRQDFLGVLACWASTNKEIRNRVIVLGGIEFPPEVLKPEDRLYACGVAPGTKVTDRDKGRIRVPDPLPWEEAKTKVPWKNLAAVPRERYPEEVQSAYLESFRIPFAAFAEWSEHRGHERPTFWRGPFTKSVAPSHESSQKQKQKQQRRRDVEADARLRNRIMKVLALARKLWPENSKRPGLNAMAKELTSTRHPDLGYQYSAVKKILAGKYPASKNLDISGL